MNKTVLGGLAATAVVGVAVYMASMDRVNDKAGLPAHEPGLQTGIDGLPAQRKSEASALRDGENSLTQINNAVNSAAAANPAPQEAARDWDLARLLPLTPTELGAQTASATAERIASHEASFCWDPNAWIGLANQLLSFMFPNTAQAAGTAPDQPASADTQVNE